MRIQSSYSKTKWFKWSRQNNEHFVINPKYLDFCQNILCKSHCLNLRLDKHTYLLQTSLAEGKKTNSKWWTFGVTKNRHLHMTGQCRQSPSPDFLWPLRRERNALITGPDPSPGHTQIGAPQRKASMLLRKQTCCLSQQWAQMMAPGPLISFGLKKPMLLVWLYPILG